MILKIKFCLVSTMICLVCISAASAAEREGNRAYIVANGGLYDDFTDDLVLGGMLQLGYDFSRYFAIEGHLGLTAENDDNFQGARVEKQLIHSSLVLRGNIRGDDYAFFAFAGQTFLVFDFEVKGLAPDSDEREESDLTFGFGADLYGTDNVALTAKWQRLIKLDGDRAQGEEDGEVDVAYIGITYYFGSERTPYWY